VKAVTVALDARYWRGCGSQRTGRLQRDQYGCQEQDASHGWNCTLTMVAFWISTLLPVFWITIGKPAAPPKESLLMALDPVTTWLALLSPTVPLSVILWETSAPPLNVANVPESRLRPSPGTSIDAGETAFTCWPEAGKVATAEGGTEGAADTEDVDAAAAAPIHVAPPGSNTASQYTGLTVCMVVAPMTAMGSRATTTPPLSTQIAVHGRHDRQNALWSARRSTVRGFHLLTDVQVGLDIHALLDQRSDPAVLRHYRDTRCACRCTRHVVGHVERARIHRVGSTGTTSTSHACRGRTAHPGRTATACATHAAGAVGRAARSTRRRRSAAVRRSRATRTGATHATSAICRPAGSAG